MRAAPMHDRDGEGVGPADTARREAAFRVAYRHSRRVRRLRVLVPVAAALIFSGVVAISWWDPLKALNLPVSVGAISLSGSKVTMEAPRLTGYTNDNRFYRVIAEKAEHDVTQTHLVALTAIDSEMQLEGGGTARVVSSSGLLDTKTGLIELTENVNVTTSEGSGASSAMRGWTPARASSCPTDRSPSPRPAASCSPTGCRLVRTAR